SQGNTHANFKLTASGEQLVLLNSNMQILDSLSFGTQPENISYARIPNGTGNFTYANQVTFAANNNVDVLSTQPRFIKETFMLMPNPATSGFVIMKQGEEEEQVSVYSAHGALLYQNKVVTELNVDIAGWAPGIYTVMCGSRTVRLV